MTSPRWLDCSRNSEIFDRERRIFDARDGETRPNSNFFGQYCLQGLPKCGSRPIFLEMATRPPVKVCADFQMPAALSTSDGHLSLNGPFSEVIAAGACCPTACGGVRPFVRETEDTSKHDIDSR